ncbi:MAG: CapA family protein [Rhodothermales bacterium]|nr:CapA family protein [Rhodothermales bacterium]
MIIDYPAREFIRSVARRYRPPVSTAANAALSFGPRPARFGSTVTIGFVGDICPLFGRSLAFGDGLRDLLGACDHLVGNFEGILTPARSRAFRLLHEERILVRLAELADPQVWTLSVANNHAGDFGDEGFSDTVGALERGAFNTFGTRTHPTAEIHPGIVLSAWTLWMNRPSARVARRDPGPGGPISIAYPHWGYEFTPTPDASMDVPAGYDLVVGHHPHVPLPLDVLDDGRPVAWSLGNFTTGNSLRSLHTGAVMTATFDADVTNGGSDVGAAGVADSPAGFFPRAESSPCTGSLRHVRFERIELDQRSRGQVVVRLRGES